MKKVFDQFSGRSGGGVVLCNIPTIYRILNIHATLGSVGTVQLLRHLLTSHKTFMITFSEIETKIFLFVLEMRIQTKNKLNQLRAGRQAAWTGSRWRTGIWRLAPTIRKSFIKLFFLSLDFLELSSKFINEEDEETTRYELKEAFRWLWLLMDIRLFLSQKVITTQCGILLLIVYSNELRTEF